MSEVLDHQGSVYRYETGCRCLGCKKAMAESRKRGAAKRAAAPKDPKDSRHGTRAFYATHGCRCDECKSANTAATKERKVIRASTPKDPKDPRHGTKNFYGNHGCRCGRCTTANSDEVRRYYWATKGKGVSA